MRVDAENEVRSPFREIGSTRNGVEKALSLAPPNEGYRREEHRLRWCSPGSTDEAERRRGLVRMPRLDGPAVGRRSRGSRGEEEDGGDGFVGEVGERMRVIDLVGYREEGRRGIERSLLARR